MKDVNKLAIVVVAYNRLDTLSRLLNSLENAVYNDKLVTLIISIDKSNSDLVEKYAESFQWSHGEKRLSTHKFNMGLRNHMLSLGKYFEEFSALCILEDDIIVTPSFFLYSIACVEQYENNNDIAGVSLYSFPISYHNKKRFEPIKDKHDVYFMNCAMSWGEVWMKNQWYDFYEWYKCNSDEFTYSPYLPKSICSWGEKSWLKYHTRYCIERNKYFVFPYMSLSTNPGELGVHNSNQTNNLFQCALQYGIKDKYSLPMSICDGILYDGFFENKLLPSILELNDDDLCVDLNGEKVNRTGKRYWLTTENYDYKIIRQFALRFHPIEYNILLNISGDDIKLYDTSIKCYNRNSNRNIRILYDSYFQNSIDFIKRYRIFFVIRDIFDILWIKLIKKYK